MDPAEPETPTQVENKAKQPNWELTEARMANLARARDKAAALRREIRDANGPRPVKVIKPTKLELELENIRLKNPVEPPPEPPVAPPVEPPAKPIEPVEEKHKEVEREAPPQPKISIPASIQKRGEFYYV